MNSDKPIIQPRGHQGRERLTVSIVEDADMIRMAFGPIQMYAPIPDLEHSLVKTVLMPLLDEWKKAGMPSGEFKFTGEFMTKGR